MRSFDLIQTLHDIGQGGVAEEMLETHGFWRGDVLLKRIPELRAIAVDKSWFEFIPLACEWLLKNQRRLKRRYHPSTALG